MPSLFFSSRYNDIFFSAVNPTLEKDYVFLKANQLSERLCSLKTQALTIAELGFGFGVNAALSFVAAQKVDRLSHLRYFSVDEAFPTPLEIARLSGLMRESCGMYTQLWNSIAIQREALSQNHIFSLLNKESSQLFQGDVIDFMDYLATQCINEISKVDIWYFDGFSPAKNPAMWSSTLFQSAFRLTKVGGTFSTYTAAGWVKRNLENAGFVVQKVKGFGTKRDMLVGKRPV